RPVVVELGGERLAGGPEVIQIVLGPPIDETAFRVELAALIVEAVADLVPDNRSNGAVVVCSVGAGIEEWRLQNGGGKVKRVLKRQVDRIHGLRRHPPFAAVDGLVEFGKAAVIIEKL